MPYDPQESLPEFEDDMPRTGVMDYLRQKQGIRRKDWRWPRSVQFVAVNPMTLEQAAQEILRMGRGCPFSWAEIAPWIGLEGRRGMKRGSGPTYRCPFCARKMVWMYWQNDTPPEAMCGCGGPIEVCLGCRWWGRFERRWIS